MLITNGGDFESENCEQNPVCSEDETSIAIKDSKAYRIGFADGEAYAKEEMQSSWSEEDEHRAKDTIYFLDTAKKHYASTVELDACIDWLNSLKERIVWKPSEEQLRALHDINLTGNISYAGQGHTLIELYNDLKKLTK